MADVKIYQLKITLRHSDPKIWRRVLVPGVFSFHALHNVIQLAMGWTNCHLYAFRFKKTQIGIPDPEWDEDNLIDSETTALEGFFEDRKELFQYEYDFGDGWIHDIKIEKILEPAPRQAYPVCLAGELACPPEDCGGIYGYYHILEVLAAKRHPEKKELKEWLSQDFDPQEFDINETNDLFEAFENQDEGEGEDDEDIEDYLALN
jgi:hypothetical protein